jgi:hypothetical protein
MALALSVSERAALRGRSLALRYLVAFTFGATVYRFTDSEFNITWGGHDWFAAGQIATISPRGFSTGSSADGFAIEINGAGLATADDPSGAALLATIYDEAKKGDAVDVLALYFDANTGAALFSVPEYTGFLAGAPLSREPGGAATMTLEIESDEIMLARAPGRVLSDPDQRRMWPTGGGGLHLIVAAAAQAGSVFWGQDAPKNTGVVASGGASGGGSGGGSQNRADYL